MRWKAAAGLGAVTAVAVAVAVAVTLAAPGRPRSAPASSVASDSGGVTIGGPFRLIDTNGKPVTERDLLGKPTAMFFGFTYCPDVCPTTLAQITDWMRSLGPDANRINVVFVTIDPERDTAKQLKRYLSSFDPRIRGLTGSPTAIAQMAKEYHVYVHKEPLPGGGYTMDHSSTIYLFDKHGRFDEPLAYNVPSATALQEIRQLIHSA